MEAGATGKLATVLAACPVVPCCQEEGGDLNAGHVRRLVLGAFLLATGKPISN